MKTTYNPLNHTQTATINNTLCSSHRTPFNTHLNLSATNVQYHLKSPFLDYHDCDLIATFFRIWGGGGGGGGDHAGNSEGGALEEALDELGINLRTRLRSITSVFAMLLQEVIHLLILCCRTYDDALSS